MDKVDEGTAGPPQRCSYPSADAKTPTSHISDDSFLCEDLREMTACMTPQRKGLSPGKFGFLMHAPASADESLSPILVADSPGLAEVVSQWQDVRQKQQQLQQGWLQKQQWHKRLMPQVQAAPPAGVEPRSISFGCSGEAAGSALPEDLGPESG